jgi:hypothetical protein
MSWLHHLHEWSRISLPFTNWLFIIFVIGTLGVQYSKK